MSNNKKIILDLCGGTGAWSKPYKDAGYDVKVITLPGWDVRDVEFPFPTSHNSKFIFDAIAPPDFPSKRGDYMVIDSKEVYGILAAPPCTMFSRVRTTAKTPRDFRQGMDIVKACLDIIWFCQYEGNLQFWVMENPSGYLRKFLGYPNYTFDPTEFGGPHNKRTDLWGYFNHPVKTHEYTKTVSHAVSNQHFQQVPDGYVRDPAMRWDAIKRSITSQEFAQAFYKANK